MKKMLTVMAGIVAAGSLMSSIARADVILGEDKRTLSPYPIEVTADSGVRLGEDESTWSPYPIEGQTDGKVGLPNPSIISEQPPLIQDSFSEGYLSAEELSKAVGFNLFEINNLPFKAKETNYIAIDKDFAEINYSGEENSLTYRKSVGTEDNSGDYNVYDYSGEIEINKIKVTVKGEAESLKLAFWTDGKYSYSISLDKAVTQKEMKDLIMEATEKEKSSS